MSRIHQKHSLLDQHQRQVQKLSVHLELESKKQLVEDQSIKWKDKQHHDDVLAKIDALQIAYSEYTESVKRLNDNLSANVRRLESRILQRDYESYENNPTSGFETVERQQYLSAEFCEVVEGHIQANTFWQYPSLEVNPGDGRFSILMNAAEPQYCISQSDLTTQAVKSHFNEFYAEKRLRLYRNVSEIPDNCVGFATSINQFEYMPLDPIKDIARLVFDKLRSGGKFLISYNDCEQRYSLELMDNNFRCLGTKSLISNVMFGLGFDILETGTVNDGVWSFMMLQKPGKLASQKLAGPEVEFIPKFIPHVKWPVDLQEYVKSCYTNGNNVGWLLNVKANLDPKYQFMISSIEKHISSQ